MELQHIHHKHGGRILSLGSIEHHTYRKRATYEFTGRVAWDDGGTSDRAHVAPWALCIDSENPDARRELAIVQNKLDAYLRQFGKWNDRGFWEPKQPSGCTSLDKL